MAKMMAGGHQKKKITDGCYEMQRMIAGGVLFENRKDQRWQCITCKGMNLN